MKTFVLFAAVGLCLVAPLASNAEAHSYHGYRGHRVWAGSRHYYSGGLYRNHGYYHHARYYGYYGRPYGVYTYNSVGHWTPDTANPAYMGYFVNGVQVAGYNSNTKVYRAYDAGTDTWSQPLPAPWMQ